MAYNFGGASGNLVLISAQTTSGGSSVSFTSGIAGYDIYFLRYYGITVSTNNATVDLVVSTNGGSSYSSTGYYQQGIQTNNGSSSAFATSNTSFFYLCNQTSSTSTDAVQGWIELYYLSSTSLYKTVNQFSGYGNAGVPAQLSTSGWWETSGTAVNAFQVAPSAGTFSGTFKLYGIQN
jgi:hypothetical protein